MVVDRTLYDILGVETNATRPQIISAFRAKSLEHHPDRGGSVEMMQQINAAREILTDPRKRQMYDQYGLKGMQSNTTEGPSTNLFDILNLFGQRNRETANRGADTKHVLKVSLEDLYLGTTKTVSIDRQDVCTDCKGTGANDGIARECTACDGTGVEILIHRMGHFMQQTQSACSTCHGTGNMLDRRNRCKRCNGQKMYRRTKRLDVTIAHGSQHGERIKFVGEGTQIPNGESGTAYVILDQQPHPVFNRRGDNLTMKLQINLAESLCGFQRVITLLDGHTILISHPAGKPIAPNSYRCLKGYGMPNRNSHTHGNLVIQFDVKFPEENFISTDSQRQQLEALLPPKAHVEMNKERLPDEAEMMDYTPGDEGHPHRQDSEPERDGEHVEGVRCPTQ